MYKIIYEICTVISNILEFSIGIYFIKNLNYSIVIVKSIIGLLISTKYFIKTDNMAIDFIYITLFMFFLSFSIYISLNNYNNIEFIINIITLFFNFFLFIVISEIQTNDPNKELLL